MTPRILIAGTRGGSGKTVVAAGLAAAWRGAGRRVAPFKKGPDYIDAAWLGAAAGAVCRNLDLFIMGEEGVRASFARADGDVAVIEGNRGLFDGIDAAGSTSSAELARLLKAPVVLVLDCSKTSRTIAAIALGCMRMDPDLDLRGVILNRTAGARHETVLRESIERACGLPVLGVLPRQEADPFPERHLGLVPPQEHDAAEEAVGAAARLAERHFDLAALWKIAAAAPPLLLDAPPEGPARPKTVRIGVCRDAAFHFYYPENLEALDRAGAERVEVSPLSDGELPALDGLYIGGGFPESFAARLAANERFRRSLAGAVEEGLPVYAECGGAVYLGESLVLDGRAHPMAGVFPAVFGFGKRPRGHGYAVIEAVGPNPFFPVGTTLRGHEFHHTYIERSDGVDFAFAVRRGHGVDGERDGLCRRNVLATYTHLHASHAGGWAEAFVRAAAGSVRMDR